MLQNSACIRNIKYSIALRAAGHSVSLAYRGNPTRYVGLRLLVNYYERVINEYRS
jgi:hypothetical protein